MLLPTFLLLSLFISIVSSSIIIQNGLDEALHVQLEDESTSLLPGDYYDFQLQQNNDDDDVTKKKKYNEGRAKKPDDSYLIFGAQQGEHLIIGKDDIRAAGEVRNVFWFANAQEERDSIKKMDEWLINGGHHHQMGLEEDEFNDLIEYIHTKSV